MKNAEHRGAKAEEKRGGLFERRVHVSLREKEKTFVGNLNSLWIGPLASSEISKILENIHEKVSVGERNPGITGSSKRFEMPLSRRRSRVCETSPRIVSHRLNN